MLRPDNTQPKQETYLVSRADSGGITTTSDPHSPTAAPPSAATGGANPVELVGTWKNWEFKSYGGSSSSEKSTFITLAADGSCPHAGLQYHQWRAPSRS